MAKEKYILTINERVALARNKRLRQAGASLAVSGVAAGGSSGVDEKGIEDIVITGTGNAITDAALSSDKSLLTLRKGATFLVQGDADERYIRKDEDDGTDYSLYIGTDLDVGGATTLYSLAVTGDTTLQRAVDIYGQVVSHDDLRISDRFVSGLLGEGGHFAQGYGEMRGLTLWEWLEVPELRYNRVSVNVGLEWQTFGAGIIESVVVTGDLTGHIKLKLEEGEIGAVAVDDLCMGIYHNEGGENDDYTEDTRDGNFHFAGFKTVYFRVVAITETSDNSEFDYILRSDDTRVAVGSWSEYNHPTAAMHFAAYANPSDGTRQSSIYSTTTYLTALHNMTSWEYGAGNIYYIRGELDGFTVGGTELKGTGIYIGNGYFSGMLQQIENAEYVMDLGLDVGDTILSPSESRTIAPTVSRAFTDYTGSVATWSVVRESEDTAGDAEWDARHADFAGVLETSYDDLLGGGLTNAMLTFAAVLDEEHSGVRVTCSAVFRYVEGVPGEDAVYIRTSRDTLVFGDADTSQSVTATAMVGSAAATLTGFNITSAPTGWGFSPTVDTATGTVRFTFTRQEGSADTSMSFRMEFAGVSLSKTLYLVVVHDGAQGEQGEQGEDAVYPVVSADNLVYAEGETSKSFTISVYKGREQVALSTGDVTFENLPSPYSVSRSESGGIITATISTGGSTFYSSISYTIQAEDMTFERSIALEYVFNGEQGEPGADGKDGADAVVYELVLSNDSLHYNAAAGAYAPTSITVQMRKTVGDSSEYVAFAGAVIAWRPGATYPSTFSFNGVTTYTFTPTVVYERVQFSVSPVEHTATSFTRDIYPTSSYMPRLQVWDEVVDGFTFEAGVVGDMFLDCVVYPGTKGGYFVCIKGHDKSSSTAPTEGSENEWWKPMNKFDNVATDLLLADTAKIDNLYVDDVYMEGVNTAIWINPNQDGIKINDVKRLEDEGRNSSTWSNPTAYFHGTAIPDPSQVYSGSGSGSSSTSISSAVITAGTSGRTQSTWTALSSTRPSVSVTTGTTVTFTTTEATFTFTQGDPLETSIIYSEMHVQLRLATSINNLTSENNYTLLGIVSFVQAGDAGATYTYKIGQKSVTIVAEASTYYIGLVYSCMLRPNSRFSMDSGSISLSYQAVQTNYISQYGANGLFIGQKSDTYFRAQVGEEGTSAYDMLADGFGLSITPSGALQQVASAVMPLGGLLLTGFFSCSSSTVTPHIWSWDGSAAIQVSYIAAGHVQIALPYAWEHTFGGYYIRKSSVQVTCTSGGYYGRAVQDSSSSSSIWGYIDVYTYNSSGTQTSVNFYIAFHYVSGSYTGSVGLNSTGTMSTIE